LAEDTIDLDSRRGMAAQKATGMRRQLAAVDADHAALRARQEELEHLLLAAVDANRAVRARQEELEHLLLAAPATDWVEAVAKARYLLILFAQTPTAEDLRRARLIADVFADFERLLAEPKRSPVGGNAWPASLIQRRIAMAKGQQRGNREAKKPKKEKPKVAATAQASFGLNPPKSAGAKDDRGKKK
jgi:hypothetical protein